MTKIVLDAETFKVLASDTRLAILKSLDERPKTVSELARELELNKATVFEHLKSLTEGELVKKKEREGRKWVYYTLGWKGKSLLHPENTTVLVLLSLGLLGSTGALLQLGNYLRWWGLWALTGDEAADGGADDEAGTAAAPEEGTTAESDSADSQESARSLEAPAEDTAAEDGSGGPFGLDFLDDGGFWLFAALAVLATALFVAAGVVKQRYKGRQGP